MRALLPLLLIAAPAAAQSMPSAPAPSAPASGPIATDDTGLRMTVPVTIGGAGPFAFLIDTGAQRTVVSRELARMLGLMPGRSVRVTAMAGIAATDTAVIPALSVSPGGDAGVRIEAPTFGTENLGAAGLLGLDTLHDRRITIDLDTRTISIAPAGKRAQTADNVPGEIVVRARSRLGQLIVTDAFVGAVRVRVILDTGSVITVGNEALRRRRAGRIGRITSVVLTSVLGERLTADLSALDHVRVGPVEIDSLPVAYADAPPFAQLGLHDKPAMLLGMDAIALFRRVEIDFPNRELRLLLPRAPTARPRR